MKLFIIMLLSFSILTNAVEEDDTIFIAGNEPYDFPSGDNNTGDQPLMLPTADGVIGIPERAKKLFPDGYFPLRDVVYSDCTLNINKESVPEPNGYDHQWTDNQQTYDVNGNLLSEYLDVGGDSVDNIVDGWDDWVINQFDDNNNLINSKSYSIVKDEYGNNTTRLLFEDIYTYTYNPIFPKRINFLKMEFLTYSYQPDGTLNYTESEIYNSEYYYNSDGLIRNERWFLPNVPYLDIKYIYEVNRNLSEYQIVPSIQQLPLQFLSFSYGADQLLDNISKGLKTQSGAILSQLVTGIAYIPITPMVSGYFDYDSSSKTTNDWTARGKVDRQVTYNKDSTDPSSYCSGFEDYAWSTNGSLLNIKLGGNSYDPQQLCDEYEGDVDLIISFSGSCIN